MWSESMLIALEKGIEGNKWFSLIDKVRTDRTLGIAWEKVRTNAGACGVDKISVAFFEKDSQNRLLAVKERLTKTTYQPKPIRRVHIPKPGSKEKRPLGIPAVIDRVVQSALKLVIEPIFERDFAPSSYGFRPGRGCKDALREVERLLRGGYEHVVDVDIKGYFDNSPHEALLTLVKERIADGKVFIGTTNWDAGRIKRYPKNVDLGVLWCFDAESGDFLWQHSNLKLSTGRALFFL